LVKLFLEHKIDVHQEGDLGFKNACEFGYYNIAKMLLDAGAKISAFNQGPIREASRNGHDKIVKLLLKNGANPRVKNRQALTWARKNEHAKVIAILEKWFEEHDE
jgi:ankyrin repeat protein